MIDTIEAAGSVSREQGPSDVERRILKHALKSFGRRGYAATTLRAVAAEAGVTAPLVSYYFKSKEGLFIRLVEIVMSSLSAEVRRAAESRLPLYESVEAVVRAQVDLAERSPAAVEFMFSLLYGPQEGQPAPDIEGMYAETRNTIRRVFKRAVASSELRPRPGVTIDFLVERLGSLVHEHVTRRFRAERLAERHRERRPELEARARDVSLEIAIDHFFFGAGELSATRNRR